jgi:hypothetical protein
MLVLTVAGLSEIGWRGIVAYMRDIKVIHDPDAEQEEWRVEDHDCDGDGGMAVAIVAGPFAEARAKRFTERLKSNTD